MHRIEYVKQMKFTNNKFFNVVIDFYVKKIKRWCQYSGKMTEL